MKIQSKYLNEIEIKEEQILTFLKGLLGFGDSHDFVILDIPGNDHFKFLQDIENDYICFTLVNPWDFFKDYDLELPDDQLERIEIGPDDAGDIAIYTIVTLGKTLQESTTNLLAPIVINVSNKMGKQFILNDSHYNTKHQLFPEGIGG